MAARPPAFHARIVSLPMTARVSTELIPKRTRVLVIGELANPDWVSVPLEGWSHYRALADVTDAHLVTHARNTPNIERTGLREGLDFTAFSSRMDSYFFRAARFLRGGDDNAWTVVTAFSSLAYYFFERRVWRHFGPSVRAGEWDIVHRLTPLSPTSQSLIAIRCRRAGVPFVLGPLNGGLPWPPGFDAIRLRQRDWLGYVREGYRIMPYYRSTRRDASAIIAGSVATYDQLPRRYHAKTVYVPENGVDASRFNRYVDRPVSSTLRLAFVGRLVPYKGADMLLEAAAPLARAGRVEIDVVGDGPERAKLQSFVAREGISAQVTLAGWVKHAELQERLTRSDLFVFPSIREFGGAVVLEAMALGLVPIVVAYGGPGELVSPESGFRLPIGSRASIVGELRNTLVHLANDPTSIRGTGARARRRALSLFTWKAKAGQVCEVYDWVLGHRAKPDFGMPLRDESFSG